MPDIAKIEKETGISVNHDHLPRHIAVIMDGNGRWATGRGLPRIMGHQHGYAALREIVEACGDLGVKVLTAYAFSTENWRRPEEETDLLMNLIAGAARAEQPMMMKNNVRMRVCGRLSELPEETRRSLEEDVETTAGNTGLVLNLAVNYGGRAEILDAVREAARRVGDGTLKPEEIDEGLISGLLYTEGLPDPDLLIRTAGEMRVSNFLLWQIAYAEIWVTSTLWPDFNSTDLMTAISDYQKRTRRFGAVVP